MQPEKLGPFRIGRLLGRGGMGAVYEGIHEERNETAAVKVLLSTLDEDEEIRLRFEAEIDTLKRLRHPNIVRLHGFGEEQGLLYYVMELVDGPSLYQEMKRKRTFQWHEVAKIGLEMCYALKHAHDRGITHRDIKPANILLDRNGSIKISDYGIAHFFGGQRLTEINSVVGTLEYMSPEQALAQPVGPRSDIYSLGAVLYALLSGRPPFTAKNLLEMIRKHQNGAIESIRSTRLEVPEEMETILFDLLASRPEDRPHSAYLVAKRFQSLLQALVGPPEKIIVNAYPQDSVAAIPPALPDPAQQGKPTIRKSPSPFAAEKENEEIIDLGGIVPDDISSLADSFNRPGNSLAPTQYRAPDVPIDLAALAMEESTSFTLAKPAKDDSGKMDKKRDSDPEPVVKSAGRGESTSDHFETKDISSLSREPSPSSKIRHGELLIRKESGIRRGKDEPIPEVQTIDDLRRPEEPRQDAPTVDGVDALHDVSGDAPESKSVEKPEEKPKFPSPEGEGTARLSSTTRFVVVKEGELDELDDSTSPGKSAIVSIQTILASICLLLTGGIFYYMLQPVSPDVLFERIKSTIQSTDENDEISPRSLRQAEGDIRTFLERHSNHPHAETVRFYEDQLELTNLERQLERRHLFSDPKTLSPVERAYLEAVASIKTDPEKTIHKLRALIDLFSSDSVLLDEVRNAPSSEELNSDSPRQRYTRTELCVEVARRRLKKLEKDIASVRESQMEKLRSRLEEAREMENFYPERADAIRRAIVELYGERGWATEIVEEAKNEMKADGKID